MSADDIRNAIINKLFDGDITGPFEYNEVRELSNDIAKHIQEVKRNTWDKAWIAFLKNKPKNPYR